MAVPINFVEKSPIPSGATMLCGFPDVGLVGVLASSHVISELNLVEMAYVDSDLLPPIVVLHEGLPHAPIRIFGNDDLLVTIAETAIPAGGVQRLMRSFVEWGKSKNVKMMIPIGGIPVQNRQDIEEPKVFGTASSLDMIKLLEQKGVNVLKEGYMVGPQALIMRYCAERSIPAIALLAQSFYNYPDPEASAATLNQLAKVTGIKVDVSKLFEKGEEIRLRAKDVMKRTQRELTKMKKGQEYDLPLYV
ncbi:MAG: PAC2 family protein [Candidatus Bathyarchaeota archaeon]|nr:PAC2 family protein [Candidatus Bathyarchaeota archaeon]MDH5494920.1 PAC2 family protein [Candidatus Bathyarchaeota archaeon]